MTNPEPRPITTGEAILTLASFVVGSWLLIWTLWSAGLSTTFHLAGSLGILIGVPSVIVANRRTR